jgi:DNA-binding Xre family transcriptional regulator
MIVYDKLWKTMKAKGISQYRLINDFKISRGQLDRLRRNERVSTYTLDQFCRILGCELSDIAEYVPDEK